MICECVRCGADWSFFDFDGNITFDRCIVCGRGGPMFGYTSNDPPYKKPKLVKLVN
jgi:hypothetical protein